MTVVCPWHHRDLLRPIWSVYLRKHIFVFWYSCMVIIFEFRFLVIMLNTIFKICDQLSISNLHFDCSVICFCYICQLLHIIYQSTHFLIPQYMLVDLTLQSSDKSLSKNKLSFVVCCINLNVIVMQSRLH